MGNREQPMDSLWLVPLPDRSSEGGGAEDGIRDAQESRGLGDVYKRQPLICNPSSRIHQSDVLLFKRHLLFAVNQ